MLNTEFTKYIRNMLKPSEKICLLSKKINLIIVKKNRLTMNNNERKNFNVLKLLNSRALLC